MNGREITSMFKATFETVPGKKCIEHLEKVFIDREIYKKGLTLDEVAYRQGQADLVRQILSEVNKDGR
jgi:hypothetical protein